MRQFRQEHVLQLLTVLRTRENVKRGEANDEAQKHLEIMPKLGEKLSQLMTGFGDALKKEERKKEREKRNQGMSRLDLLAAAAIAFTFEISPQVL